MFGPTDIPPSDPTIISKTINNIGNIIDIIIYISIIGFKDWA